MLHRPELKPWICPTDRHLSLRAQLSHGWSSRSSQQQPHPSKVQKKLTSSELRHIKSVIKRAEQSDAIEQKRVGCLVHKLDCMHQKASGNGRHDCLLCAERFIKFVGATAIICTDCKKKFCTKCCVDYNLHRLTWKRSQQRRRNKRPDAEDDDVDVTTKSGPPPHWVCKICNESRQIWKQSGAWFYRRLPKYVLPGSLGGSSFNRRDLSCGNGSSISSADSETDFASSETSFSKASEYSVPDVIQSSSHEKSNNNNVLSESRKQSPVEITISPAPSSHRSDGKRSSSLLQRGRDFFPRQRRRRKMSWSHETNASRSSISCESFSDLDSIGGESCGEAFMLHGSEQAARRFSMSGTDSDSIVDRLFDTDSIKEEPAVGQPKSRGTLEFSLLHDTEKSTLQVNLIRARNLNAKDLNGYSDPYVKLNLLPGSKKSTKMRSRTVKNTLNPKFDETLIYYGITDGDLDSKRLRLMVFDEDMIGTNDFLGEVQVPLRLLKSGRPRHFDVKLGFHRECEVDEVERERGRILVWLCHEREERVLEVRVPMCAGLVSMRRGHALDVQVKVYLSVEGVRSSGTEVVCRKSERRKSPRAANLVFRDPLRLPLPPGSVDLMRCALDVTVWNRDKLGRDSLIGAVHFGIHSENELLNHWRNCIQLPGVPQEKWQQVLAVADPDRLAMFAAAGKRSGQHQRTSSTGRKLTVS